MHKSSAAAGEEAQGAQGQNTEGSRLGDEAIRDLDAVEVRIAGGGSGSGTGDHH